VSEMSLPYHQAKFQYGHTTRTILILMTRSHTHQLYPVGRTDSGRLNGEIRDVTRVQAARQRCHRHHLRLWIELWQEGEHNSSQS